MRTASILRYFPGLFYHHTTLQKSQKEEMERLKELLRNIPSANTRLAKSTKNARLQCIWSAPHSVPKRLSPFKCIWITPIQPEPFCLGMGFADAICMQL